MQSLLISAVQVSNVVFMHSRGYGVQVKIVVGCTRGGAEDPSDVVCFTVHVSGLAFLPHCRMFGAWLRLAGALRSVHHEAYSVCLE